MFISMVAKKASNLEINFSAPDNIMRNNDQLFFRKKPLNYELPYSVSSELSIEKWL